MLTVLVIAGLVVVAVVVLLLVRGRGGAAQLQQGKTPAVFEKQVPTERTRAPVAVKPAARSVVGQFAAFRFSSLPLLFLAHQLYFCHGSSDPPYPVDELPVQPLDNRQVSMALRGRGPRPAHSVLERSFWSLSPRFGLTAATGTRENR